MSKRFAAVLLAFAARAAAFTQVHWGAEATTVAGATPTCVRGSTTTVIPGTTRIEQVTLTTGLPPASIAGMTTGTDGKPTATWLHTQATTIVVPTTFPVAVPCETWSITSTTNTIIVGSETIVIKDPVLTLVPPSIATATVTVTAPGCRPTSMACTPSVVVPWTQTEIANDVPLSIAYDNPEVHILTVQDAGWKVEQYAIDIDGRLLGVTGSIAPDDGTRCGAHVESVQECLDLGLSRGEFAIPAGKHVIGIKTIPGIYEGARVSPLFYTIERHCPSGSTSTDSSICRRSVDTKWTEINVPKNAKFELPAFDYGVAVNLTIVDGGYRTEKYSIEIDGRVVGRTTDYVKDRETWCGVTADTVNECVTKGFSTGTVSVPSGRHIVTLTSFSEADPEWSPSSAVFFRVEGPCDSTYI